ncbi:MAG: hypothetical protein Alpg2KO_28310 [Alphaproteobacteria bacterium]
MTDAPNPYSTTEYQTTISTPAEQESQGFWVGADPSFVIAMSLFGLFILFTLYELFTGKLGKAYWASQGIHIRDTQCRCRNKRKCNCACSND